MAKAIEVEEELREKTDEFIKKIDSNMFYQSNFNSDSMSFDWIKEIDFACKYLDNIVRNPKLMLLSEEDIVKIEKARKIGVASVKDLTRHTQFIEKIDPITEDVTPAKVLINRNEDSFTTYENRFVYTLIKNLDRFITKKDDMLKKIEIKNSRTLEYAATTAAGNERIHIELKVTSNLLSDEGNDAMEKEINLVKQKMKRIKEYMTMWRNSEFVKSLDKSRALLVSPPIKKNNVILKNPNFQIAMKLWDFLQNYQEGNNGTSKDNLNTKGNEALRGILDDAFLMDYYALDSISNSKREQKTKLSKYAILMIHQQIKRIMELLISSGVKVKEDEILAMIAKGLELEQTQRQTSTEDVKLKFKNIMDEYLEKTQDYL